MLDFKGFQNIQMIPTMTSTTAPYGVVSSTGSWYPGYDPYRGMNTGSGSAPYANQNFSVTYTFVAPINLQDVEHYVEWNHYNNPGYSSYTDFVVTAYYSDSSTSVLYDGGSKTTYDPIRLNNCCTKTITALKFSGTTSGTGGTTCFLNGIRLCM